MKSIILVLLLLMTGAAWSQELPFLFKGRVENSDISGYEGGVTVAIVQNNGTVFSVQSASNGKYNLRGNINYSIAFEVVFSKEGLVSKRVKFDLTSMNEEDAPPGEVRPVAELDMTMFKVREDIDFTFLDSEPVASFDWSSRTMSSNLDQAGSEKMRAKINNLLLKGEKDKAELEKNYTEAMFQAEAAYEAKEYPKALEKYQEANGYKPEEEKPKTRIIELEALIKAQEEANAAENANNKEYDNLISEADALKKTDNLEAAVKKYKEAIKIKDETYPKDQVALLTKQIEDEKKENESQAAYDAAMNSGESLLNQKSYRSAKDKFTEASKLKPNEKLPKSKLEEVEALLNAAQQEESEKKQYDDAIAAADALFNKEDWFGAKDKYALALSYESSSSYAKGRKKICEDNFASQEEEIAKLEKLNALLNTGFEAMNKEAYREAVNAYTEVLKIEANHPEATENLAISNQKLEEASSEEANENEFNNLVEQGDTEVNSKNYQEAIDKYNAAIAVKASAAVTQKIKEAQKQMDEESALAAKNREFNLLVEEGNELIGTDKLIEAKVKFEKAKMLDPSSDIPPTKIQEIETLLADQKSESDKQKNYEEAISTANTLFDNEDWAGAKTKYNVALGFTENKTYAEGQLAKIKLKLNDEQAQAEQEAKIAALLEEGKEQFDSQEFEIAKDKYEEVLALDNSNAVAISQIEKINTEIAALKEEAQKEEEFNRLKEEGFALADQDDYSGAKSKLNEALSLKDDQAVKDKIREIEDAEKAIADSIFEEEQALAEKEAKITALLKEGKNQFDSQKFEIAKEKYEEVLALDNSNATAQSQIEKINTEIAALKGEAEKEEDFNRLKEKGFVLADQKDYSGAKSKLNEALSLKDDQAVKAKIKEIEDAEKALAEGNEAEKKYNDLLADAKSLGNADKNDEAIEKYREALTVKPGEPAPLARIAELEAKIKEIEDAEKALAEGNEMDKKYNGLLADAKSLGDADKNDLAIAKYREALAVKPAEQAPLDRIAELELKIKNGSEQALKDKEYNALMQKGEDLLAQEKFLEAIKEFNNALAVKPGAIEPVDRAAEAERLAKESTSDEDAAIQKNLRIAEEKMNAGDYERASSILDVTEKSRPGEPRIEELRSQIETLKAQDKEYNDLMTSGNTLADAANYEEAKLKYEAASLKKPSLDLPKDKVREMSGLIKGAASAAQKDQLYAEYMSKGAERQTDKEYELALSSYQDALSIKAGDVPATNKINEIQQILDDIANENASAVAEKNKFDALIKEADQMFSAETYPKAKVKYEEALRVISDNAYAQLQVEECIRLSKLISNVEEERQYQKIITSADKNFDSENYDKAIMRYNTAIALRKTDPYPKQRLAEIEAILNPQTQAQAELQDLGTPFSGSILDGTFALQQAEDQRKQANKTAVQKEHAAIYDENSTLTTEKTKDQYDNSKNIYNVLSQMELDQGESDLGRQETVSALKEIELKRSEQERQNRQYEYLENIGDQEVLYSVNREVALDYGIRDKLYADNAVVLQSYAGEIEDLEVLNSVAEQEQVYAQNESIKDVYENIRSEMIDDFAERDQVRQEVYDTRKQIEIDFTAISKDNYERLIETKDVISSEQDKFTQNQIEGTKQATANNEELKDISNSVQDAADALVGIEDQEHYDMNKDLTDIKEGYDTKAAADAKSVLENNDDITAMKLDVDRRERIQGEAETAQLYKADRNMAIIKEEMISDQKDRDNNRQDMVVELRIGERELTEAQFEMANSERDQRMASQARIEAGVKENSEVSILAGAAHSKKVKYVEQMDQKARAEFSGLGISDDAERLNKTKEISDVYSSVQEDAAKEKDKQVESGQVLEATKKVVAQKSANQSIGQDEKHYDAANNIHNITSERNETVKTANTLGEEYPEGVSQESFSQNDQNGLMKALITRRVVVIDGHADVYVRTQSGSATTFSKNGNPSLQHVWNSETQGPHLERHY
jgi:epidermal growth factor receptor substrate 15